MRYLILNHQLNGFAGTEINALEICLALRKFKIEADLGALIAGEPMTKVIKSKGLRLINLIEQGETGCFDYDVIWGHHPTVIAYLIFKKKVKGCRILYSCHGTLGPLGAPPLFHEEIHLCTSHNPINTRMMVKNGVSEDKIYYFPNHAPQKYFKTPGTTFPPKPRLIAVVSNHPPEEVRYFAKIARKDNIRVDFYGFQDRVVLVNDSLLKKYDLVITIGKTVIYCFALSIPVYCYDHFGGLGYITPENFTLAKDHNFSGKESERKITGEELYQDIIKNYYIMSDNLKFLQKESAKYFCLEKNLESLISKINTIPITKIEAIKEKYSLAERTYDLYFQLFEYYLSVENHPVVKTMRSLLHILRKIKKVTI